MALLGDSPREIQACIDALNAARTLADPAARLDEARRVLQRVAALRKGRRLSRSVGEAVEADELERAVAVLELYKRSNRLRFLRVVPLVLVPLIVGVGVFASPKSEAERDVGEIAGGCSAAVEALGEDAHALPWARGCGSTHKQGDQGREIWSLPVRGSEGGGRLSYLAEKYKGEWHVIHAALSTGDRWIGVVPCTGEISEEDAKGMLVEGLWIEGTVDSAEGAAPVAVQDRCELEVLPVDRYPAGSSFNCQVRVRCNGQAIYGDHDSNGYVFCAVRDGLPEMALDVGGTAASSDPILEMVVSEKRVVVSDDDPTVYSFTVALD